MRKRAHVYREFSNENSKLKAPRHFSGAFKPSILRAGMYAMGEAVCRLPISFIRILIFRACGGTRFLFCAIRAIPA